MAIRKEERWRCQNPSCKSEILVMSSSEVESGTNPRCSCGSLMKKAYVTPAVRTYPATEEARHRFGFPTSLDVVGPQTDRAVSGKRVFAE
jgi:hypothetical protein